MVEATATLYATQNDMLGFDQAAAGDVDGEGHDDVLVVVPADDSGGTSGGTAYLVYGPLTGTQALADVPTTAFSGEYSANIWSCDVTDPPHREVASVGVR